jgi:hypothetical protein
VAETAPKSGETEATTVTAPTFGVAETQLISMPSEPETSSPSTGLYLTFGFAIAGASYYLLGAKTKTAKKTDDLFDRV